MAVRPKLMIGVGIALAGLGLIGAGAGATFTAQVSADTSIRSGGLGLSLNGESGSGLDIGLDGQNISSHFTPISQLLRLKNTGTLDMASVFLSISASGCDGRDGAALANALHVKLVDETNENEVIYDDTLCALANHLSETGAITKGSGSSSEQGVSATSRHADVGGQLPRALRAGESISYRIVIQTKDSEVGLPPDAQYMRTHVKLVFTGFDY